MAMLGSQPQTHLFADSSKQRKIRILSLLRQRGPMTRAEIARASGIAKSSISVLIDGLLSEGHVHQVRANSGNRSKSVKGRPGDLIEIDPSAGAGIGIEISFGKIIGVIGDVSHEVLASQVIEFEIGATPEQQLKICESLVSELLASTRVTPSRILGIGIGITSAVYKKSGEKFDFAQTPWNEFDIVKKLSEATGFQVHFENSANLAGYAETIWGAGKALDYYLYFKYDRIIDGALIVNQSVVSGTNGGVADFGHLVIDNNGPMCNCGIRGCLTAYAGFESVIKQASLALGYEVTPKAFLDLIKSDNFICKQIQDDCAQRLGQGIGILSRVLNPEAIVVGSSCMTIPPEFIRITTQNFSTYSTNQNEQLRIFNGQLGELATALGAVALVLNYPRIDL